MTVYLRKHQDHERNTGMQVFDVEIQPSTTPGEGERDLRSYVEQAHREQQMAENNGSNGRVAGTEPTR